METGSFTLQANENEKTITLTGTYNSTPSVNLTSNTNISMNCYFIVTSS